MIKIQDESRKDRIKRAAKIQIHGECPYHYNHWDTSSACSAWAVFVGMLMVCGLSYLFKDQTDKNPTLFVECTSEIDGHPHHEYDTFKTPFNIGGSFDICSIKANQ